MMMLCDVMKLMLLLLMMMMTTATTTTTTTNTTTTITTTNTTTITALYKIIFITESSIQQRMHTSMKFLQSDAEEDDNNARLRSAAFEHSGKISSNSSKSVIDGISFSRCTH